MKVIFRPLRRGQTILEYVLMIAVFVIPTAIVINDYLQDSGDDKKDNVVRKILKDSYGDENGMGVIGRPYP